MSVSQFQGRQSRQAVNPTPASYFDGQWPTVGAELFRSVYLEDTQLLEPMQVLNQAYQIHDGTVTGTYAGDSQNIYVLVTKDFLQPPTLVPSYGLYMDTVQDVYRNMLQNGIELK